jgi:light-regulated signal transduction histidine kinase (bacteriophytochrome)
MSAENNSLVYSDMNVLLQEVLTEMEDNILEKKARLIIHELPHLYVNPGLIRPLFYNLVSNALKYSRPNSTGDQHPRAIKYCRREQRFNQ